MVYTDISRNSILRRRTPRHKTKKTKKEKKVEVEVEDNIDVESIDRTPPPSVITNTTTEEIMDIHQYSIDTYIKLSNIRDNKWQDRDVSQYYIGMLVKVNKIIDTIGWKWWERNEYDDTSKAEVIKNLTQLYQFVILAMLSENKIIPECNSRPQELSSELLFDMVKNISKQDSGSLLKKIYSIVRDLRIDIDGLNIVNTTISHIKTLRGYITGEYIPKIYVDNELDIFYQCDDCNNGREIVDKIYTLYRIPKGERLLL